MPGSGGGLDCLDYWGLLACLVGETDLLEPDHLELSRLGGSFFASRAQPLGDQRTLSNVLFFQADLPEDTFDQEVASLPFERKHIAQTCRDLVT
jgi:hypothetical protein